MRHWRVWVKKENKYIYWNDGYCLCTDIDYWYVVIPHCNEWEDNSIASYDNSILEWSTEECDYFGKEIYEGDRCLVTKHDNAPFIVDTLERYYRICEEQFGVKDLKIVGNVHENKGVKI